MSDAGLTGPPKPRRAFRVGVVGHRLDRLPTEPEKLHALHTTVRNILDQIRKTVMASDDEEFAKFYTSEPPILRAISPLAEGTDRIFAEEALDLGYELCCPLPFYQEEFEKDFTSADSKDMNSLGDFRAILARARDGAGLTIFELDGDRTHASEAYGAAGRVVLNQSDVLIAVWDGGQARGAGGTVETLNEAIGYNVPVIWVNALEPAEWRLLRAHAELPIAAEPASSTPTDVNALNEIVAAVVKEELDLPRYEPSAPFDTLAYFREIRPARNFGFVWKMFRNLVADGRTTFPIFSIEDFASQIRRDWPVNADGGPRTSPVTDWVNSRLRVAFGWADGLADYYADAYRSAFVTSYILAALAVFLALFPTMIASGTPFLERMCGGLEFACLLLIAWLLIFGPYRRWHGRWTDYRLIAELIRELRFLVPLGGGKPSPRIPTHLAFYGDPAQTWMYWYVRAIARETGMPAARVTPDFMCDCIDFLDRLVGDQQSGQLGFHIKTYQRTNRLEENLRLAANFLLVTTLIGVSVRLGLQLFTRESSSISGVFLDRNLLALAAVLPALGAAVEGISRQGEFIRIAKRSAAVINGFHKFAAKIAALKKGPPSRLADVIPLSSTIAETMVAEVVDWRAILMDRR